jgi:hypothetical protein
MTRKDLQNMVGVYRNERNSDGTLNTREVYLLPAEVRINTFRANNTTFTAAGAVYTQGAPSGRFIRSGRLQQLPAGLRPDNADSTTWFSKDQRSSALT